MVCSASGAARFILAAIIGLTALPAPMDARAQAAPTVASPAPDFVLPDATGKLHSLREFLGKPIVLFFFCGCNPCHDCARSWAQVQKSPAAPNTTGAPKSATPQVTEPLTLVVFTGQAADARAFVKETGLNAARTVLLIDSRLQATVVYHAAPCPRVFVIDTQGLLRYTNDEQATARIAPAALSSRIVIALRQPATTAPRTANSGTKGGLESEKPLTVVAQTGVQQSGSGRALWDAGSIDVSSGAPLEHTFILKNETGKQVAIGEARGSCGCETLLLTRNGAPIAHPALAPGDQVELKVSIRTAGFHAKSAQKYVWITGASGATVASLEIRFGVRDAVAFTPDYLNFGRIARGMARELSLVTTVDASVVPTGGLPPLVSSNPDVRAEPVGAEQRSDRDGRTWITRSYRVTLSRTARQGYLSGRLQFQSAASVGPVLSGHPIATSTAQGEVSGSSSSHREVAVASEGRAARSAPSGGIHSAGLTPGGKLNAPTVAASKTQAPPLSDHSVALIGEIIGDVSAEPRIVFFGKVSSGVNETRKTVLSGKSLEEIKSVAVTSNSPWITIKLQEPTVAAANVGAAVRPMEVTLSGSAPGGALRAQITVTTAQGERLILPVMAMVNPKAVFSTVGSGTHP